MLDGHDELLSDLDSVEQDRARGLDAYRHIPTDELELLVRAEHAGQQPRLAEDLEAVADAEHGATSRGEAADRVHRRREAGDRAATKVVAVREAAGEDDRAGLGRKLGLVVPDENRIRAECPQRPRGVAIVVGPREREDGDARAIGHCGISAGRSSKLIWTLSMRGFASSSEHMRSSCPRA